VNLSELVIICAGNPNLVLYTFNLQCLLYSLTCGFISTNLYQYVFIDIHIGRRP